MSNDDEIEAAARLAREAIALCDRNGQGIAAAHIQLGLDRLKGGDRPDRLHEDRSPWVS